MPRKNDSWGIEVGANALKAMRLVRAGDHVELADYEIMPFKQILATPDINVDEAIQVQLDKFITKHDVSDSTVVVSVPGHAAFARFAKLPPVEPKKVPDIVRYEAVQQIPFPIDQVEWDYQVFQGEDSPDVEVGIFAITKERVLSHLNNYRQVGLEIDQITLSPLAVYNAFRYETELSDKPDAGGTIYMDIGTQSTDVIIVEAGGIWLRTLPIGGNNFTEALVRAFKLSFPKAEKLKREAGTSKYAKQIFQAMRPVFADLVQELQRSLGYYQNMNRDANLKRLVGVGSTFRLPGLQKFLKQQLQLDVRRPDGFRRLQVPQKREAEIAEHGLNLATAYGLALQGLGLETVGANLMPRYVLAQRMWRAKQPWIAAAAACIALAVGGYAAELYTTKTTHSRAMAESQQVTDRVLRQAQSLNSQWTTISSNEDPRQQLENLRRVLDYRDLWPKLLEDVAAAAHAPDSAGQAMHTDQEVLAELPRDQRRQIHISRIETQYQPEPGAGEADDARMRGMMAQPRRTGDAESVLARSYSVDDFFSDEGAPTITITVRGTTPYAGGTSFVTDTLVRYLRENADRPDRPYRFVVPENPYAMFERRRDVDDRDGRTRPRPTAPRMPRDEMEYPGPGPGPGPEMGPGIGGRGLGGAHRRGNLDNMSNLLPRRPLADEPIGRDHVFEVRWQVELRRPEQARGELAEPAEDAAPEAGAPGPDTDAQRSADPDDQEARS